MAEILLSGKMKDPLNKNFFYYRVNFTEELLLSRIILYSTNGYFWSQSQTSIKFIFKLMNSGRFYRNYFPIFIYFKNDV